MREQLRRIYEEELAAMPSEAFVSRKGEIIGLQEEAFFAEKKRVSRKIVFSLALILFFLFAGGVAWQFILRRPAGSAGNVVERQLVTAVTHRSEYKYLLLPDSTQVWLNAASTLEFPASFGKARREVVLTGEAYFNVKHAEQTPFIIYTGKVSTEVLGTAFNIKAYPDMEKITIAVRQGKVKVNYADREAALLTRGQQISIGIKDSIMRQKKVNAEEMVSWQDGELIYDDYALGDIVADLKRVYDVDIIVEDPVVSSMRVSTAFKRQSGVKKAMEVLSELADAELVQSGGKFILK